MKVRFYFTLIFTTVFFACANADDRQATVSLVSGENYFPFASQGAPRNGWSVALVEQVFSSMGVTTEIEYLPWERGLKWTKDNKYLATFPYIYTAQRAEDFLYSQAINHVPVRIYVSKTSGIEDVGQLRGRVLCLPQNYVPGVLVEEFYKNLDMIFNQAYKPMGCVTKVQKGWSDAGLINGYFESSTMSTLTTIKDMMTILPVEIGSEPLYLIIAKTTPNAQQWIDKFNAGLAELSANGEKQAIDIKFKNWLSNSDSHLSPP